MTHKKIHQHLKAAAVEAGPWACLTCGPPSGADGGGSTVPQRRCRGQEIVKNHSPNTQNRTPSRGHQASSQSGLEWSASLPQPQRTAWAGCTSAGARVGFFSLVLCCEGFLNSFSRAPVYLVDTTCRSLNGHVVPALAVSFLASFDALVLT